MEAILREPVSTQLLTEEEVRLAGDSGRRLAACIGGGSITRLRLIESDQEIHVPTCALRMLVDAMGQRALGHAVGIVPIRAELTLQEAADYLNVSRPFLIGLLEAGELPSRGTGTHCRVTLKDLMAFRAQSQVNRRAALDELARDAQDLSIGY